MASKDKYKSLLEWYEQALTKNSKLNLSAYCRLNGVSVSGMHPSTTILKAVLSDDYIVSDETYFKILVPEKNSKGKGVKKGYFWVIVGQKSGLLYVVYRDGSRAGDVIYDELHDYHGTMHSDAASFYRKIQGDDFPNITRIACQQHIKRNFIDCQDAEPDVKVMVDLINILYHEEPKHRIGENGWTIELNFK